MAFTVGEISSLASHLSVHFTIWLVCLKLHMFRRTLMRSVDVNELERDIAWPRSFVRPHKNVSLSICIVYNRLVARRLHRQIFCRDERLPMGVKPLKADSTWVETCAYHATYGFSVSIYNELFNTTCHSLFIPRASIFKTVLSSM
jgi:hypothetical protein